MIPKNKPTHPGKFVKEDILKELVRPVSYQVCNY